MCFSGSGATRTGDRFVPIHEWLVVQIDGSFARETHVALADGVQQRSSLSQFVVVERRWPVVGQVAGSSQYRAGSQIERDPRLEFTRSAQELARRYDDRAAAACGARVDRRLNGFRVQCASVSLGAKVRRPVLVSVTA